MSEPDMTTSYDPQHDVPRRRRDGPDRPDVDEPNRVDTPGATRYEDRPGHDDRRGHDHGHDHGAGHLGHNPDDRPGYDRRNPDDEPTMVTQPVPATEPRHAVTDHDHPATAADLGL